MHFDELLTKIVATPASHLLLSADQRPSRGRQPVTTSVPSRRTRGKDVADFRNQAAPPLPSLSIKNHNADSTKVLRVR
jgi:hypothetical protein